MTVRMGYPGKGSSAMTPMCLKARESVPMPEYAAEKAGAGTAFGKDGENAAIFSNEVKTAKNLAFSH